MTTTTREPRMKFCKMTFSRPIPRVLCTFENSNPEIIEITFGWIDVVDRDNAVRREREIRRAQGWNFIRFHAVPAPEPVR